MVKHNRVPGNMEARLFPPMPFEIPTEMEDPLQNNGSIATTLEPLSTYRILWGVSVRCHGMKVDFYSTDFLCEIITLISFVKLLHNNVKGLRKIHVLRRFVVLLETRSMSAVKDPLQTSPIGTTIVRGSWGHWRNPRVSPSMWVKPGRRWAMSAGSSTAWSPTSSPRAPCPATQL